MSDNKISIVFGAMADPIRLQLRGQYRGIGSRDVGHLQRDADAVSRLLVRGLITASSASGARKKILQKLIALLNSQKKEGA